MDPDASAVITPHLLARETLLWSGRPHDTSALRWRAGAIILVGIAALALRSLPLDSTLAERADINSILLAVLVCVLIAEAIVFHRYLSNTFYGVTNQRVLIVSGLRELEVTSVFLDKLNTPWLSLRRAGRNLELGGVEHPRPRPFGNPSVLYRPDDPSEYYRLLGLERPHQVYDLIVEATNKLK
jgi:hypothetical protein